MDSLAIVLELTRVAEPDDPHAFHFEPQGYTLRGPTGGLERFEIPWSPELLADLDALRRPGRDPAVVQRVGEVMQRALRPIGWAGLGERIRAAGEAGRPVVVTLRSNAAELYALPWELLTVGPSGQHLGELAGVLLRHEWPATATSPEKPAPRPEGGRVLFAWSAAGGAVPAAEHQRALDYAWSEGHVGFDRAGDVLAHASPARLAEALAAAESAGKPFTVLHLLVHGGLAGSTFGLALDGEDGARAIVDAGRLRQLLAPHAGTLRLVVLAACDGGNTGALGNHLGSVAQALHRAGIRSVVASRYPLSVAGSNVLAEAFYHALLVDLHPLERAFTVTRARLAQRTEHLDWASLQLYARAADGDDTRPVVFCPYRGLLVFEGRHRRFFFGRDAECRETLGDLQALIDGDKPRFLVVVGASGTGKSSMVLAGVAPDIALLRPRRPGPCQVLTMVPGSTPRATLHELLGRRTDERPLLLIVDQFEELFTHTADPGAREAFVRELWSLSRTDTGIHVIVTLRVDFLGDCGELVVDESGLSLDRVAYDEAHRVFVARMAPAQVRAAIEEPAALVGLTFAPGLLDRILSDVGDEPGALPLLQYALARLWEQRHGRILAAEVYAGLGGLVGALAKDADALIGSLADDHKQQARRILTRLVDTGEDEAVDTRRRVALDQLTPGDEGRKAVFDEVLTRLLAARLVVRGEKGGAPTLEVAHEALLRKWPTLRTWIAEDRATLVELDKLKDWARDWAEHRTLLTGTKLDRAGDFVRQHPDHVDAAMRGLVQASEDERRRLAAASEAQRRRRRNTVIAVISILVVASLGMTGVSIWAVEQRADAVDARTHAEAEKDRADAEKEAAATERDRARQAAWMAYAQRFNDIDPARALVGLTHVVADETPGWLQDTLDTLGKPNALAVLPGGQPSFSPDGRRVVTVATDGIVRVWSADGSGGPVVLRGHEGEVHETSFSPDGQRLVTVSEDRTARVWNADGSGEPVILRGHEGAVLAASFSPDGRRIGTGSEDNTARVWNADGTGAPVVLRGHQGFVLATDFSTDGRHIFTASLDRTVRVWKADGSGEPNVLRGGDGQFIAAVSDDRRRFLTASLTASDTTASVWNADGSGKPVVLRGHEAALQDATLSPDGQRVVTASQDKTARVWNADGTGEPVVLRGHKNWVRSAKFSRDGRRVVTASDDGTARVWNADGSGEPVVLRGHKGWVRSASFSRDGRRIVTTSDDGTTRVWNAVGSSEPRVLRGHEAVIWSAGFSRDGGRILTASNDNTARVWNADGSGEPVVLRGHEGEVSSASFSPDGRRIVTASFDRTARVWSADGAGDPVVLRGHEDGVVSVEYSRDGRRVVTASVDKTARVWNTDGSGEPVILRGHEDLLRSASFSPDGRHIVTASEDATARVWNADGAGTPLVLRGHEDLVRSASFSPDGRRIVTASDDATARVWSADGAGEPVVLRGHALALHSASFSPDGRRIVTASFDLTARVWNADGSGEPVVLRGHEDPVRWASFSPDGRRILTASTDATGRVWNADGSGEPVVLRGHEEEVLSASFSPDGRQILTAGDKTARVWILDPSHLRSRLAAATTLCIPPGERVQHIGERPEEACDAFIACERKHGRSGECPQP